MKIKTIILCLNYHTFSAEHNLTLVRPAASREEEVGDLMIGLEVVEPKKEIYFQGYKKKNPLIIKCCLTFPFISCSLIRERIYLSATIQHSPESKAEGFPTILRVVTPAHLAFTSEDTFSTNAVYANGEVLPVVTDPALIPSGGVVNHRERDFEFVRGVTYPDVIVRFIFMYYTYRKIFTWNPFFNKTCSNSSIQVDKFDE